LAERKERKIAKINIGKGGFFNDGVTIDFWDEKY
jgi:hypothetical protein